MEGVKTLVKVYTNYKNLKYFVTSKKLNYRQAWWLLYLTRFNFKLYYYPRKLIGKFNTLSQRPNHNTGSNNQDVVLIKLKFLMVYIIKNIVVEDEKKILLTDICYRNQMNKQEELVVRVVQKL